MDPSTQFPPLFPSQNSLKSLPNLLPQFTIELNLLTRITYMQKNQHRVEKWWKSLGMVRRDCGRVRWEVEGLMRGMGMVMVEDGEARDNHEGDMNKGKDKDKNKDKGKGKGKEQNVTENKKKKSNNNEKGKAKEKKETINDSMEIEANNNSEKEMERKIVDSIVHTLKAVLLLRKLHRHLLPTLSSHLSLHLPTKSFMSLILTLLSITSRLSMLVEEMLGILATLGREWREWWWEVGRGRGVGRGKRKRKRMEEGGDSQQQHLRINLISHLRHYSDSDSNSNSQTINNTNKGTNNNNVTKSNKNNSELLDLWKEFRPALSPARARLSSRSSTRNESTEKDKKGRTSQVQDQDASSSTVLDGRKEANSNSFKSDKDKDKEGKQKKNKKKKKGELMNQGGNGNDHNDDDDRNKSMMDDEKGKRTRDGDSNNKKKRKRSVTSSEELNGVRTKTSPVKMDDDGRGEDLNLEEGKVQTKMQPLSMVKGDDIPGRGLDKNGSGKPLQKAGVQGDEIDDIFG